ncbi:MAG: hypothetical protein OEV62_11810, partial [Actinomycetota bacterium]|nr:hypothetical protein [Actinomycetota bacterium]
MTEPSARPEPSADALTTAQAEIDRLRRENEQLRAETAPAGGRGHHWIRGTAVVVLMVLGFVLVPVAGVAVWTRNTLLNTDRYVETVAPLAQSQAVIDDVAQAVTTAIFNQFDVEAALQKNLPPELSFAAGPIANQVESTTNDLVVKALGSDQFDALWRAVNRQASASVVAFVTGSSSDTAIQVKNGQLVLDIQPILADVKQRLTAEGFDLASKLPSTDATVDLPVANVQYLVDARQLVKLLNTLAWLLPLLALLCFAGAVALSRNRRRALITTALLVSGAALLVGLALAVGRAAYIDATTSEAVSADTAAVVYDTVVRFLKNGLRVFFLLGLVVAFGAAVTGESAWAVATRRTTGRLVTQGGEKSGLDTGRVGAFFARHRTGYRV